MDLCGILQRSATKGFVSPTGTTRHRRTRYIVSPRASNDSSASPYGKGAARRVVVTGQGVVSSLGHDTDEFYSNLLAGKSGISTIESFDASDFSTKIAGEIKSFDASGYVQKKWVKRQDKVMLYLQVAGKKALEAAGVSWEDDDTLDKTKCGILIGTAMGGLMTFSTAAEALAKSGHRKMNPFCIPFAISNMGGAMLAIDLGFMGPNYSISTACATGNYCIMQAAEHIRRGEANLMLAGGADAAVIPSGIGGFIACKALSKRNDDPAAASRPWDKNRDGFVMGEGAGVLALEELEHAKARGAPILAEFIGGAFTCDAHHISDPDPEGKGVISCIKKSLENARISPTDVDYVNAHGTSTPAGDMAEYRAITSVLGHENVRINSTKSMIGHLLGGAGAVEAVAVVEAIRRDRLHPNLNLDDPEDGVNLNILVGREQQAHTVNEDFFFKAVSLSHSISIEEYHCQSVSSQPFLQWLSENGAPDQKVTLQNFKRRGRDVDVTVAKEELKEGDVVLRIPESLIVTLDRIFEDGETREGSYIYPFIKELDRQAGRGSQGAKSPLLWSQKEIDELLAGSTVIDDIKARLKGIKAEYDELDTVWFMGSSLFRNYPFEIPTEQFSFEVFKQAFAAIQGSVVHLQGVELSKRFALVPLGPPLLTYSSTCKAVLRYCEDTREIQLAVDREYAPGDPVYAWCGPQPNSKLLINYGVVDPINPYDKMPMTITIPNDDPLFRAKRNRLADAGLATSQAFQLSAHSPVPEHLLAYLRLTFATTEEEVAAVVFDNQDAVISMENEQVALSALMAHLQKRLDAYRTSIEEDDDIISNPSSTARQVVAASLLRAEKSILFGTLKHISERGKDYNIGIMSDFRGVTIV
eukprot:jgi/Picre1/29468/NNA_004856.t1